MTTHHFAYQDVRSLAEKLDALEVYLPDVYSQMPRDFGSVFYTIHPEETFAVLFVRRNFEKYGHQWEETAEEVSRRQIAFSDFPMADVWIIGSWKVYFSIPAEVHALLEQFPEWTPIPFIPDFIDKEWPLDWEHPLYSGQSFKHAETRLKLNLK